MSCRSWPRGLFARIVHSGAPSRWAKVTILLEAILRCWCRHQIAPRDQIRRQWFWRRTELFDGGTYAGGEPQEELPPLPNGSVPHCERPRGQDLQDTVEIRRDMRHLWPVRPSDTLLHSKQTRPASARHCRPYSPPRPLCSGLLRSPNWR